ncbi:hypothetical protein CDD83_3812 [Cordyceps sp. RAO-2017]|nr:hypothetical protein CDD83_3812 [Cordyceps sp. RAO-2017]
MDYRLSASPQSAPRCEAGCGNGAKNPATAQHPDHIKDVRSAIGFLAKNKAMEKYILIGHSAGGTLAFQLLMGEGAQGGQAATVPLPSAIVGTAGIYDIAGLVNDFQDPFYTNFTTQAFGCDRKAWDVASPAKFGGNFKQAWPGDNKVVLARSRDDQLVNLAQLTAMEKRLSQDGIKATVVTDLTGDHDAVWREGSQLVGLLEKTVGLLDNKQKREAGPEP